MEDLLEKIIPIVLCIGGIYYFWNSSRKDRQQLGVINDKESEMLEFAYNLLVETNVYSEVVEELKKRGCKQEEAEKIATDASNYLEKKAKRDKIQYIVLGLLFAIGGLVITLWSYAKAANQGGTYYVTWGAVVYGVYLIYKGLKMDN